MKRIFTYTFAVLVVASFTFATQSVAAPKGKRAGAPKTQVIFTGEIAKKVIGYNGPTPLNITISGGKITNIEALENNETPKYFKRATDKIFPQYIGKTIDQAIEFTPDIATGATYSSKALIENIRLGLQQAKGSSPTRQQGAKPGGKRRMTRK